jgi:hypothetical protein
MQATLEFERNPRVACLLTFISINSFDLRIVMPKHLIGDRDGSLLSAISRCFLTTSLIALSVACGLKIVSLRTGDSGISLPLLSTKGEMRLYEAIIAVEMFVIALLSLNIRQKTKLLIVFWISLNFCAFHVCAWISGATYSCGCLGKYLPSIEHWASIGVALFMFLGSILLLTLYGQEARVDRLPPSG